MPTVGCLPSSLPRPRVGHMPASRKSGHLGEHFHRTRPNREPGPGFCPRKGSSQLQPLKTLAWRNQNQQRQPSLFHWVKPEWAHALARWQLSRGRSGRAVPFSECSMIIKR